MLTLMLLRHAKSSWSDAGLTDIDRPLNGRGKRAASGMGVHMTSRKLLPDLVLCSPARRTRDSWKLVAAELKAPPRMLIDDQLYDFGDGENLIACIRRLGDDARTLLVVGHNPSLEELAQRLSSRGDEKLRARLEKKFPTGALAVIALDIPNWSDLADGKGRLVDFVRPKDIMEDADD